MEALAHLVTESLGRHGLDRPIDFRRLQWSRWVRCDSPRSLLIVPSKPGIFALAEEIADLGTSRVGTAAQACPERPRAVQGGAEWGGPAERSSTSEAGSPRPEAGRMLAVFHFSEDDDMAFTLDRMFTRPNPLRDRLAEGNCFLRFVVVRDSAQRHSICNALKQWQACCAERASGVGADFDKSFELFGPVAPAVSAANFEAHVNPAPAELTLGRPSPSVPAHQPFPSGF